MVQTSQTLDYRGFESPKEPRRGLCSFVSLLIIASLATGLWIEQAHKEKTPSPQMLNTHLNAKDATAFLTRLLSRWGIPETLQCAGGDWCYVSFFDTSESYYRVNLQESSFNTMEAKLLTAPQNRNGKKWIVQTGLAADNFGWVTSPPPSWWKGPVGNQIRRIKVCVYSGTSQYHGREWWVFFDPADSIAYIFEH